MALYGVLLLFLDTLKSVQLLSGIILRHDTSPAVLNNTVCVRV